MLSCAFLHDLIIPVAPFVSSCIDSYWHLVFCGGLRVELSCLSPNLALTDEPDYNGWMGRRALGRAGQAARRPGKRFLLKCFGDACAVRGELESCS